MSGGGALGLGKSKQQAQSSSFGFSQAESGQHSESLGFSTQEIAFQDLFQQLYGGATGAASKAVAQAPELASAARQLFTGGTRFLEDIGGDAGTNYLTSRISGENPLLDEQIGALEEDVGRLFTERLNPAITSRAVAGGTLGGGRQGVAQGLATETAAREFTRGALELRSRDMQARDAAAAQVATNSLAGASTGLGALPSLLDLTERGQNAELGVYSSLSSILGGPTVLTEAGQRSFADAFSRSYGQETSQSSSKGKAWNFNMSGYGGIAAGGGG